MGSETASKQVLIRMTPSEVAAIDGVRGALPRGTWLKRLAAEAVLAARGLEQASGAAVSNALAPAEVPVPDRGAARRKGMLVMGPDPAVVQAAVVAARPVRPMVRQPRPIVQKR